MTARKIPRRPTVPHNETVDRILDGAIRAVGRRGLRKLSMSDVAEEAAVSRGTLYRYFTSREQLLDALGHHVQRGFEIGLQKTVADHPEGLDRLRAALEWTFQYGDNHPETARLVKVEPAFVLEYLGRELPNMQRVLLEAIRPALEDSEAVRAGVLDASMLAEMFLRLSVSQHFVPNPRTKITPKLLIEIWTMLADAAGSSARVAKRRRAV